MEETISEVRRQLALASEALREACTRPTAAQLALEIKGEIEMLGNLVFLARKCSESAEELEHYLRMSEKKVATLRQIVRRTFSVAPFAQAEDI
jgi:hypothetical protein